MSRAFYLLIFEAILILFTLLTLTCTRSNRSEQVPMIDITDYPGEYPIDIDDVVLMDWGFEGFETND